MGSLGAMAYGSKDRYFQEGNKKLVPEGVEGRVPYKGSVVRNYISDDWWNTFRNGIFWFSNIEELFETATFVVQTSAGLRESHPHDISITKEAPNYSVNSYIDKKAN